MMKRQSCQLFETCVIAFSILIPLLCLHYGAPDAIADAISAPGRGPSGILEPVFVFLDRKNVPYLLESGKQLRSATGRELIEAFKFLEKPLPKPPPPSGPSFSFLVRSASYDCTADVDTARFEAVFEIMVLDSRKQRFTLPFDGSSVSSVSIDGKKAAINLAPPPSLRKAKDEPAPWISVGGQGLHTVRVRFEIPVVQFSDQASFALSIPRTAMGSLRLFVKGVCENLEVVPSVTFRTNRREEGIEALARLPYHGDLFVRWTSKPRERPSEASIPERKAEKKAAALFDCRRKVRMTIRSNALAIERTFDYRVKQGVVKSLSIDFPTSETVYKVSGQDIRRWWLEGGSLEVAMDSAFDGSYRLKVFSVMSSPGEKVTSDGSAETEIVFQGTHDRSALTEKGFVAVLLEDEGELQPVTRNRLTRIDLAEAGIDLLDGLAYKFIAPGWKLNLRVVRRPKIEESTLVVDECRTKAFVTREDVILTTQTWKVINDSSQFLRIGLPPDSALLSCFVDNLPKAAGRGSDPSVLLIPLVKSRGEPGHLEPFSVEISYVTWADRPNTIPGRLTLRLAKSLDHVVRRSSCQVFACRGERLVYDRGSMRRCTPTSLRRFLSVAGKVLTAIVSLPCTFFLEASTDMLCGPTFRRARRVGGRKQAAAQAPCVNKEKAGEFADDELLGDVPMEECRSDLVEGARVPVPKTARPSARRQRAERYKSYTKGKKGLPGWFPKHSSRVKLAEKKKRRFIDNVRKSYARKGNLPVRARIAFTPPGVSRLSFAQELVAPGGKGQELSFYRLDETLLFVFDMLNLLAGVGLFMGLWSVLRGDRTGLTTLLLILLSLVVLDCVSMNNVDGHFPLAWLLLSVPIAALFTVLRGIESFVSAWIEKRRQRIFDSGSSDR